MVVRIDDYYMGILVWYPSSLHFKNFLSVSREGTTAAYWIIMVFGHSTDILFVEWIVKF